MIAGTILGIDPGLYGAVAFWDRQTLSTQPSPVVKSAGRGNEINWDWWVDALMETLMYFPEPHYAFVEKVGPRPNESRPAAFKFGFNTGGIRGIIAAWKVPVTPVHPQVWKKAMGVAADKQVTIARACEMFPSAADQFRPVRGTRTKQQAEGAAEAALIAEYGWRKTFGRED